MYKWVCKLASPPPPRRSPGKSQPGDGSKTIRCRSGCGGIEECPNGDFFTGLRRPSTTGISHPSPPGGMGRWFACYSIGCVFGGGAILAGFIMCRLQREVWKLSPLCERYDGPCAALRDGKSLAGSFSMSSRNSSASKFGSCNYCEANFADDCLRCDMCEDHQASQNRYQDSSLWNW